MDSRQKRATKGENNICLLHMTGQGRISGGTGLFIRKCHSALSNTGKSTMCKVQEWQKPCLPCRKHFTETSYTGSYMAKLCSVWGSRLANCLRVAGSEILAATGIYPGSDQVLQSYRSLGWTIALALTWISGLENVTVTLTHTIHGHGIFTYFYHTKSTECR